MKDANTLEDMALFVRHVFLLSPLLHLCECLGNECQNGLKNPRDLMLIHLMKSHFRLITMKII